jgi:hypothetical protein
MKLQPLLMQNCCCCRGYSNIAAVEQVVKNFSICFSHETAAIVMYLLLLPLLLPLQGLQQRRCCGAGAEELQQGRRAPGGRVAGEWRASCVTFAVILSSSLNVEA